MASYNLTTKQQLLDKLDGLVDDYAKEVCEAKEALLFDKPDDPEAEAAFQLARDLHGYLLDARYRMSVRVQQHREARKQQAKRPHKVDLDLGLCCGFDCDRPATTIDDVYDELCERCLDADPNAGKWQ